MLAEEIVRVFDFVVHDLAEALHGNDFRVDKAAVGLKLQGLITGLHFLVEFGVDVDSVGLDQILASRVVSLALDALDLGEQLGEQAAISPCRRERWTR